MKTFIIGLVVYFIISLFSVAVAGDATPSATNKKIEDLKDRLATKVAELRQTSRRAIFGTVKSTSITSFVVETKTKDVKIELTDDIAVIQYLKGKRTTLTVDDIAKGDTVAVFGEYNTTLDLLKAAVMFIQGAIPERVSGSVTGRDEKAFTLTITTLQNQAYTIDIEKSTKALAWDREKKELVKSGFSKIAAGNVVHIVGFPVPKKELRISATRIIDLGNLAATASSTPKPTVSPTP